MLPSLLADVSATVQPLMAKNGNMFEVRCGPDLGMRAQTRQRYGRSY